jgi:hypothetical protein
MLKLLQKQCYMSEVDVGKKMAGQQFDKYFCSEDHASKYSDMNNGTLDMKIHPLVVEDAATLRSKYFNILFGDHT